jgi:aminoglycoside phosphotransferase (APT) family kinase protein
MGRRRYETIGKMSLRAILPIGGAGFAPLTGAVAKRHIAYQAVLRHCSTVKQAFPTSNVVNPRRRYMKDGTFKKLMKVVDVMYGTIKEQIPLIHNCKDIVKINKGFSADDKHVVIQKDDSKLLLRIFDLSVFDSKKSEYAILERMQDYNINCSKPIRIGKMSNNGYMLTSYIEGIDAQEELPNYSDAEQFQIGSNAGKELRKMHQYSAPKHISPWYSRKVEKHQKYIDAYITCDVRIKNDKEIMQFIEENIYLMKQRPNLFQHDDFHVGNIIVNDKKFAGIIDFNRYDWGDPIHEFLKVGMFSREVSVPFSIGQIKGYFNDSEPDEYFWRLYSLYLAMCVFSTVVWTIRTIPDNIEEMLDKVYTFLEDHEYFRKLKPVWYSDSNS